MNLSQFTESLELCVHLPEQDKRRILGIAAAMPQKQLGAFLVEMQASDRAIGAAMKKDDAVVNDMEKTIAKEERTFLKMENAQLENDERGQHLPSLETAIDDSASPDA